MPPYRTTQTGIHGHPEEHFTGLPKSKEDKAVPYKYNEPDLLREIASYIEKTYHGHYVGEDNVQSFDLILASGHATGFNVGNILKYGSRYGKKRGFNRDDLLKVIHYALFELYVHNKNHRGDNDGNSGEQRSD